MFQKVSLQTKLISAFLITASLVVVVSYFNLQTVSQVHESFANIVDSHVPRLNTLQEMRTVAASIKGETIAYQSKKAGSESEVQKNQLLADLEKLSDRETDYLALANDNSDAEKQDIRTGFKPVSDAKAKTVDAVFELIDLKERGATQTAIDTQEATLVAAEAGLERSIAMAIDQDLASVRDSDAVADADVKRLTTLSMLIAVLAGAFALLLGISISITIARNLKKLKDGAARVAAGDFSHSITIQSHDELGQLAITFNRMSSSLQESYRRLDLEKSRDEAILQGMSEGLITVDVDGRIVLMNQVAATLIGVSSINEVIGRQIQDVYVLYGQDGKNEAPLPTSQRPVIVALKTGELVSGVYLFHPPEGGKRLLSMSATPVKLKGNVVGAIAMMRDVTKEKEIDRMKTEFISLASHQLRTPLSAIRWFSEMLLNGDAGKLNDEQQEFAKNISDSTERMIQLVNSLLNISRIESGRIIIDPKPTDLSELVAGIVNDLKAKIEERNQTLIVSVHHDLPKVNLDARLISQVYMNLLTNAIKYTPKGGEVSVFVSRKGDDLISQVTDNGYGIPKAEQARAFQKFFRAENVKKVETDGTGLGLYLIKAIIESSGGKIWFESEEGKGTTFWFTLPLSGMKAKEGEVTLDM